jgi:hypothetical protein
VKALKLLKRMTKAMKALKEFKYTVFLQSHEDSIDFCHVEMVSIGVWVETKEEAGRTFIPYTNIQLIVEEEEEVYDDAH